MTHLHCSCTLARHQPRFVVLTGGPGAGKTAVLEVVRRHYCHHVAVLPESASILFGGGFPRRPDPICHRAAQRAIYHVQHELERWTIEEGHAGLALCDRGTLDGLAYWPGAPADYFADLGITLEREFARYAAVIHLHVPPPAQYNHENPLRTESPRAAAAIDDRIAQVWSRHPRYFVVESSNDFLDKAKRALALVSAEVPACCRV
jgi:predicted ATPase